MHQSRTISTKYLPIENISTEPSGENLVVVCNFTILRGKSIFSKSTLCLSLPYTLCLSCAIFFYLLPYAYLVQSSFLPFTLCLSCAIFFFYLIPYAYLVQYSANFNTVQASQSWENFSNLQASQSSVSQLYAYLCLNIVRWLNIV